MPSHPEAPRPFPLAHPPLSPATTRVILVRHGRSTFNDQQRYQGSSDAAVLSEQGWHQAQCLGQALKSTAIDAIYASPLRRAQQTVQGLLSEIQAHPTQVPPLPKAPAVWSEPRAAVAVGQDRQAPPLYTHDLLREIHLPAWEGRSYHEVRQQDADSYRRWVQRPHEFAMTTEPIPPALETLSQRRQIPLPDWASGFSPRTGDGDRGGDRHWVQLPHEFEMTTTCLAEAMPENVTPSGVQTIYPVLELYQRAQAFWQDVLPKHIGETILIVSHGGTNHALISAALGLPPSCHHRLQQSNGGISILDYCHVTAASRLWALNLTTHLGETLPKLKVGKQGVRLVLLPVGASLTRIRSSLLQMLQNTPITYSLTQVDEMTQAIAPPILAHCSDVLSFQVRCEDFAQQWHRALTQIHQTPALTTGLAIAPRTTLQSLIAATIGLPHPSHALALMPGTLSVLHYPPGDHPPVLQAMNLGLDIHP
ncbi:MAG: histidine phosphatase family protein [Synechococcales bacterium]|nr:histidine phosphatase family protein [Synechococcales bacterium]